MHEADQRPCLLVVDDEPLNRELLRRVLREYRIEEAEDATAAMQVLERSAAHVRLILCDQLMPGLSGTQLAERVRDRWPDISFMLLTGYDDDPAVKSAHERGLVCDVIAKPWRGSALKELIADTLEATISRQ